MNTNIIQIKGITPSHQYPPFSPKHPCKQVSQTDNLCVPCQKPEMKDIIEVIVSLSIATFKVISTIQGDKLIIDGVRHIKILYTADNDCTSVHSAHFDVPFCEFILLKTPCREVLCIEAVIEHIAPHQMSCREFAVCTIILLCPVFKEQPCPPHPPKPCDERPRDENLGRRCCCRRCTNYADESNCY